MLLNISLQNCDECDRHELDVYVINRLDNLAKAKAKCLFEIEPAPAFADNFSANTKMLSLVSINY
jgi:hypothetical protein